MEFQHNQLGKLWIDDHRILTFPEGLYGFAESRRFALVESPELAPFQWLASLDDPDLAFAVLSPIFAAADYEFDISDADEAAIGQRSGDPLTSLVIVNITEQGPTANLRGPIVINGRTCLARQIVLHNPAWRIDHPLRNDRQGRANGTTGEIIEEENGVDSRDGIAQAMEGRHARTHTSPR